MSSSKPSELWNNSKPKPDGYRECDGQTFLDHCRADVTVIDIRDEDEFNGDLGHVPNSKLVPLNTLESECESWDRNQTYLFVCRSGVRSAKACIMLKAKGFEHLINLWGGMLANENLKIAKAG